MAKSLEISIIEEFSDINNNNPVFISDTEKIIKKFEEDCHNYVDYCKYNSLEAVYGIDDSPDPVRRVTLRITRARFANIKRAQNKLDELKNSLLNNETISQSISETLNPTTNSTINRTLNISRSNSFAVVNRQPKHFCRCLRQCRSCVCVRLFKGKCCERCKKNQ
jgi:hypothetical protein